LIQKDFSNFAKQMQAGGWRFRIGRLGRTRDDLAVSGWRLPQIPAGFPRWNSAQLG
jgi:hypothetical protein